MTNQTDVQLKIKILLRWVTLGLLFSLCGLLAVAIPSLQEEEDSTRRLWNKQFEAARANAKKPASKPSSKVQKPGSKPQGAIQAGVKPTMPKPGVPAVEKSDSEFIGVTIWRLRGANATDDANKPRLLVQKEGTVSGQFFLERVEAGNPFSEGQLVRMSVEVPREGISYLYIIDREIYSDGQMSDPYLIFPAQSTPFGGNALTAGKILYIPAQGDPIPYFTLQRSRKDQVGERLTIIISPEPLSIGVGSRKLDPSLVAQWEKQWAGPTESREAANGKGREWTTAEKEAGEGQRLLVQSDPLPQTIFRVKVNSGGPILVNLPLKIAP